MPLLANGRLKLPPYNSRYGSCIYVDSTIGIVEWSYIVRNRPADGSVVHTRGNKVLKSTIFEPQRVEGCESTAKFPWFVEVSLDGDRSLMKLHARSLGGSDRFVRNV